MRLNPSRWGEKNSWCFSLFRESYWSLDSPPLEKKNSANLAQREFRPHVYSGQLNRIYSNLHCATIALRPPAVDTMKIWTILWVVWGEGANPENTKVAPPTRRCELKQVVPERFCSTPKAKPFRPDMPAIQFLHWDSVQSVVFFLFLEGRL